MLESSYIENLVPAAYSRIAGAIANNLPEYWSTGELNLIVTESYCQRFRK